MDQDGVKVHKLAKKEQGQYAAILTKQAWSIKDLFGFWGRTQKVVPSGKIAPSSPLGEPITVRDLVTLASSLS